MPSSALGHTSVKGRPSGLPVPEHELELSQNDIPISTSGGPMFDNFLADKIEYLMQRVIVGRAGLVLLE